MRIRNTRTYDIYLPYAGPKRGWLIKAGKVGPEVPPDRFYDQLLQRDWRRGHIELVLNDDDKIILGSEVAALTEQTVSSAVDTGVTVDKDAPDEDAPEEDDFEEEASKGSGTFPAPDRIADEDAPEEDDSEEEDSEEEEVPETGTGAKFPLPKRPAGHRITGKLHCTIPDCKHASASVKYVETAGTYLCMYHRASHNRWRNKRIEKMEETVQGAPVETKLADAPPAYIPDTESSAPSLTDLMEENKELSAKPKRVPGVRVESDTKES